MHSERSSHLSLGCRTDSPMYDFIDWCLRNKNDMIIDEGVATIVSLKCLTSKELRSVINILQTFLSSQIVVPEMPSETRRADDLLLEHLAGRRRLRVQTDDRQYDHLDHRRKSRAERSRSVWTIVLHLLDHEGPERQVHSLHLQPCSPRQRSCPSWSVSISFPSCLWHSLVLPAVSASTKFGATSEQLLLLQRTMFEQDDEVRDRATFS